MGQRKVNPKTKEQVRHRPLFHTEFQKQKSQCFGGTSGTLSIPVTLIDFSPSFKAGEREEKGCCTEYKGTRGTGRFLRLPRGRYCWKHLSQFITDFYEQTLSGVGHHHPALCFLDC